MSALGVVFSLLCPLVLPLRFAQIEARQLCFFYTTSLWICFKPCQSKSGKRGNQTTFFFFFFFFFCGGNYEEVRTRGWPLEDI
ncbi:hypothetical protein Nepgr_009182 [Nepenthes gracilis]|uniref:Secreted protein n=1 Tax=Nepenthes gracilis TaxID=150966 RepID=A0AAD3SA99_NEPGR|nr:hypothetical protein Nepgr_009182 [Nepenthes gracilis]